MSDEKNEKKIQKARTFQGGTFWERQLQPQQYLPLSLVM